MTHKSKMRVFEATRLIVDGGLPIWRAAMEVGWGSPQLHIYFKQLFGETPGQFVRALPEEHRGKVYHRTKVSSELYELWESAAQCPGHPLESWVGRRVRFTDEAERVGLRYSQAVDLPNFSEGVVVRTGKRPHRIWVRPDHRMGEYLYSARFWELIDPMPACDKPLACKL